MERNFLFFLSLFQRYFDYNTFKQLYNLTSDNLKGENNKNKILSKIQIF